MRVYKSFTVHRICFTSKILCWHNVIVYTFEKCHSIHLGLVEMEENKVQKEGFQMVTMIILYCVILKVVI